jgi:hypothetical protein
MYKPKVYTASKPHHFKLWQHMHADPDWSFIEWTASWVTHPEIEKEVNQGDISPETFRAAWVDNIRDVKESDFLLLYSGGEVLRGALVEAGCAIGLGIPVLAVGLPADHSWAMHPGVVGFSSIKATREYLYRYTVMVPSARKRRIERYEE